MNIQYSLISGERSNCFRRLITGALVQRLNLSLLLIPCYRLIVEKNDLNREMNKHFQMNWVGGPFLLLFLNNLSYLLKHLLFFETFRKKVDRFRAPPFDSGE